MCVSPCVQKRSQHLCFWGRVELLRRYAVKTVGRVVSAGDIQQAIALYIVGIRGECVYIAL